MPSWADLNERQQQYMQAIYDQDQENERHEKGAWPRGDRPCPATEWRWMFYGIFPVTGSDSPLRCRLKVADLVDPGTGATFDMATMDISAGIPGYGSETIETVRSSKNINHGQTWPL